MKLSKQFYILIVILAGLILGLYISHGVFNKKNQSPTTASILFTPPQSIADFSLVDSKGSPFNKNSLWGHWTLLSFGFTSCPEVCRITMNALAKTYDILLKQKQNPMPQVVFISIFPKTDTLAKIGDYAQSFNLDFQAATGAQPEIDKLLSSLNVLYIKARPNIVSKEDTIEVGRAILLMDPSGKLVAIFSMPHDPMAIARDFQMIVANSG